MTYSTICKNTKGIKTADTVQVLINNILYFIKRNFVIGGTKKKKKERSQIQKFQKQAGIKQI